MAGSLSLTIDFDFEIGKLANVTGTIVTAVALRPDVTF